MKWDLDTLLEKAEDTTKSAWTELRLWGPRLILMLVPPYVIWFGRRWPNPDVWNLESLGVAGVYLSGVAWGLSMVFLALPIAIRGTTDIHGGRLYVRTVAGRRVLDLQGAVARRWLVANTHGPSEHWLSIRRDRRWLLMSADSKRCEELLRESGAEVHQGSRIADHVRGFPLLAAWLGGALVGLFGAMVLVAL